MKSLNIRNLILIEKAEIAFGPSLNILTGETGSGKSAILSAIRLICGERADTGCIRKGADFAVVEAIFEGPLFIRREIHRSGKSRCFIDDRQVNAALLRQAAHIEMVDQNSASAIFAEQKEMLDTFSGLKDEVKAFERSHTEEKEKEAELQKLSAASKEQDLKRAMEDFASIEEVGLQPGEEEKLAEEHHLLTHAQELAEKIGAIAFALNEGGDLPALKRILTSLESCLRFDPKLAPTAQLIKSSLLELEEAGRSIQNYSDRMQADPDRLAAVEKRIGAIESLKRRFGTDLLSQKEALCMQIERLTALDGQIASLKRELEQIQKKNSTWAESITQKRKKGALPFASQVLDELKSLNIPHAQFEISVGAPFGAVRFFFSANPGLSTIPLEDCASGGELSRLLLAIKIVLAEGTSTLVFDEIDSNVGGHTAAILGQKLQQLAEKRQVICVTHFVQVAKCAQHHFLVSKEAKEDSAYTIITKLNEKEKDTEYHRMLGNKC